MNIEDLTNCVFPKPKNTAQAAAVHRFWSVQHYALRIYDQITAGDFRGASAAVQESDGPELMGIIWDLAELMVDEGESRVQALLDELRALDTEEDHGSAGPKLVP